MTVKLLSEQHLEFLSLKGGYTGLSESIHVKMPHYGNLMLRLNDIFVEKERKKFIRHS